MSVLSEVLGGAACAATIFALKGFNTQSLAEASISCIVVGQTIRGCVAIINNPNLTAGQKKGSLKGLTVLNIITNCATTCAVTALCPSLSLTRTLTVVGIGLVLAGSGQTKIFSSEVGHVLETAGRGTLLAGTVLTAAASRGILFNSL